MMKIKNKTSDINNLTEVYLQEKIPNLKEHYQVWSQLEQQIDQLLNKVVVDQKQQKTYDQLDSELFNFTICLSGLLSISMGLNYKSTSIYLSNDSDSTYKIKMRLLHNYFNIYSKEEYFEYFNQLLSLKEPYDIAKLSLIYDLKSYKAMYQDFYHLNNTEMDEIDINFAFINYFRPRISINFLYAHHIVETILLLRLGDDLNYVEHREVVAMMPVFAIKLIEYFKNWKEFIKNYILSVVFVNLNANNHLQAIGLAQKLINSINDLINNYALDNKDQWVNKIIKYEE